jgi:SAM-dependent methyltransferase
VSGVHPVARAGFGAAADVYERARPSYPEEAVVWLGLGRGDTVVDVGAGTGKLTRLLVATHARVIAVEPVEEMRGVLLERVPGAEVRAGTAEELGLPDGSADLIAVAQAFHWFDHERALAEFHRVLAPGGRLALVWNMRDLADPLQRAVEDLIAPYRHSNDATAKPRWRTPLEESRLFGPVTVQRMPNEQLLTVEGLCERVASTSFVAVLQPAERDALLDRVRALVRGRDEPIAYPYVTEVYVTIRTS